MKRLFLGDSFDIVKRLWQEILSEWAPLYAEPRFIPTELRQDFTLLTRVSLLGGDPPAAYSILNDPDTGIRLPGRANQSEGRSHITPATIRAQLSDPAVRCVVTFDQSNHRESSFTSQDQRATKLLWLRVEEIEAFYYVSHAPFLFACSTREDSSAVIALLKGAGIPENRVERIA